MLFLVVVALAIGLDMNGIDIAGGFIPKQATPMHRVRMLR
jgi:hypothetical protein